MDVRRVLSYVRRACEDYDMIKAGDRIAVGISGGKDSLTLLCALAEMRRFYPNPFEVVAITVDMGFPGADFAPVAALCDGTFGYMTGESLILDGGMHIRKL